MPSISEGQNRGKDPKWLKTTRRAAWQIAPKARLWLCESVRLNCQTHRNSLPDTTLCASDTVRTRVFIVGSGCYQESKEKGKEKKKKHPSAPRS